MDLSYQISAGASTSFGFERKPKAVLRDREMFIASLLRENSVRTMDIAKMMKISERSVTRLLAKARDIKNIEYDEDVLATVSQLLEDKDELLNVSMPPIEETNSALRASTDDSKRQLAVSLLAMNVKTKDIAKMLDVCEKTIQRWKTRMQQQQEAVEEDEDDDDEEDNSVFQNLLPKEEVEVDELIECDEGYE